MYFSISVNAKVCHIYEQNVVSPIKVWTLAGYILFNPPAKNKSSCSVLLLNMLHMWNTPRINPNHPYFIHKTPRSCVRKQLQEEQCLGCCRAQCFLDKSKW